MNTSTSSIAADGSDPTVPAAAMEAEKARVIRVFFPPGMAPIVDQPMAIVAKGDLIIWHTPLPDPPDFSIVFRNVASEDSVPPSDECLQPSYEDGGRTLDGRTLYSRITRSVEVTSEQLMPRIYFYVVRLHTSPPTDSDPFSIIIRQPQ